MFRQIRALATAIFATALAVATMVAAGVECQAQSALLAGRYPSESYAERTILAALERSISVDFVDTPLHEVAAVFQRALGGTVVLDMKALQDASISPDTPINFTAQGISARSALDTILQEKDLGWITDGDLLVITTSEKTKVTVTTRVYPVADLVFTETDDAYEADFDSLIEVITSIVSPATWDSAGGAGSIAPFGPSGALAISQTRRGHEEIESLLVQLRQARDLQGLPTAMKIVESSVRQAQAVAPPEDDNPARNSPAPIPATPGKSQWRIPRVYH